MSPNDRLEGDYLVLAQDTEAIQAVVLAAAIGGNAHVRGQLPALIAAFEEPYRTVASCVSNKLLAGEFVDRHMIGAALESCRLIRCGASGGVEQLTPAQVIGLIFATDVQPGQPEAYLETLRARRQAKQKVERRERALALAESYGDQPDLLLSEFEQMAAAARQDGTSGTGENLPELLEVIPYVKDLTEQQQGNEFLGLNSGFQHYNSICNGLDMGLGVLAAPPGRGKTTLLWQIACQTAEINQVPVIFVSMEQSKKELRAKALARFSKLQYRHLLRGRLRSDDSHDVQRLLDAARRYALLGRHVTVIEGDDATTIDSIYQAAATAMAKAGASRCLIALDYRQILPLRREDVGRVTNTKDRIDLHVSALRRIARKLDSPVIAISSENRAGYGSKGLKVFKESGGIEYSADITMVLARTKNADPGQGADFKALDLVINKNRNGETGIVKFKFYAKRMEFVETAKEDLVEEAED